MNKLASIVAATMLTVAFGASAAPDTPGMGVSRDAGTIFEWVDDNGRKHASDTVPDKYKGVAKPVDPGLFQIPAAQQEEARRQAEALKARAASVAPPPAADAVQAESQRQNRSAPAPSAATHGPRPWVAAFADVMKVRGRRRRPAPAASP